MCPGITVFFFILHTESFIHSSKYSAVPRRKGLLLQAVELVGIERVSVLTVILLFLGVTKQRSVFVFPGGGVERKCIKSSPIRTSTARKDVGSFPVSAYSSTRPLHLHQELASEKSSRVDGSGPTPVRSFSGVLTACFSGRRCCSRG